MTGVPAAGIAVRMVVPQRAQCGISDYSAHLAEAMRPLLMRLDVSPPDQPLDPDCSDDIVHVQHQYFLFGGLAPWKNRFASFARSLRRPAVMTVHEIVEPSGGPFRRAAIARTNHSNFAHRAIRALIVHTEADRDRLTRCGVARERIVVIRHGVPTALSTPARDECRRACGVEDRFVLLLPGFISRRKGHLLAIAAMRALPGECVLAFAGGRHPDDATSYVQEVLGAANRDGLIADRVRVTGYLVEEHLASWFGAADIVLAPSIAESGSGSLALAFAQGSAIVASDIAAHREIVEDTPGSMRLFRAGDAVDLAAAVESLIAKPELRQALAEGARRYAERHSYASVARETVALYSRVLAGEPLCA